MIKITRNEADKLRAAGLFKEVAMTGRKQKGRRKTYYAIESQKVKKILGRN